MQNEEYYKNFLDYKDYKGKLTNITYANFIQEPNIKKIFAETLNESMIWLFIWELWIKKPETCYSYYVANKKPNKTAGVSFEEFNFNPYDKDKNKQIAILNFEDIITFFNKGVKNGNFSQLIKDENIKKFLTKLNIQKVDYYIDQQYANLKDSLGGTFLSVLSAFDILPDEYYSKEKFITNNNSQTAINYALLSTTRGFAETINRINEFTIVPTSLQLGDLTKAEYFQRQQEDLESISSKIYLIIQSFLDMYCSIYNDYYNEVVKSPKDPPSIDMSAFNISKQDSSSLPLEQYILMAKPKIKPAFKKSYIVRENNLKPYLTIRMEYQVGENSNDYIDVNYFDIPYNNILNIEHNVKDFSMTINLTDTEGSLSELLIQKMYAVSQRKNNAMVEKNIDSLGEYRFFVEYGWSGPNSDDVDELMEDQVYVKTIHRGYIKSISSQYSFKGNEYTLTIIPNDLNSYNSGLNDTSSLYFRPMGDEKVTIPLGLLALFFLFKNPANDLFSTINEMKGWQSSTCKKEDSFLQKLFSFLDHIKMVNSNGQGFLILQETDTSPKIVLNGGTNAANRLDADSDAILNLLMDNTTNKSKQRINSLTGANLTEVGLDALKDKFDAANISLNGWLAGLYVIWKLKQDGDLILCDTTGLFDVFDGNKIKNFITFQVIKKLNPYALDKKTKEFSGSSHEEMIYNYIKTGENKSKFNKYSLSELFNLEPNNNIVDDNPRPLTFLIAQLSAIFNEIKNVGMDCEDEKGNPNIFHAANGIRMNYDFFKPGKDNEEDLYFEYKKKIYSDRNNIYVSKAPPIEKDNRHEDRYEAFKKHAKEVLEIVNKKIKNFDENNAPTHRNEIKNFKERTEKFNKDKAEFSEIQSDNDDRPKSSKFKKEIQEKLNTEKKRLAKEEENINIEKKKLDKEIYKNQFPIRIIYLSYITDPNKVAFLNCSLGKKISLLGKQLVQSYSFTPRITPRTRNANKQFFSQGNRQIMYEGTGDIIEFSIDPLDIGNFNSVMLANKNKNNVGGFNGLNSNLYAGGMYQNATQYYRSFRSIEGGENPYKIAEDMARLDRNYQTQTTLKGSITIPGEPYWSNINLLMAKCIYIHIYYANGMRSSHSGLYYVSGVIQNISEGKFTTRLEIVRAPTFLASLEKKMSKNIHLG